MGELIAWLTPILLADIVNPVLLAAVVFGLGSRRPYSNATLVLAGWFVVYLLSGVLLAVGFEKITELLENPRPIDFVIEIILSFLLIWIGVRVVRGGKRGKEKEMEDASSLTPASAFGIGALINLIGMPFAIPYFAVVDQILKADLEPVNATLVLVIYNAMYVAPFALIVILRFIFGKSWDPVIERINIWLDRIGKVLMPVLLFGVAAAMLLDGILYFTRGTPLF